MGRFKQARAAVDWLLWELRSIKARAASLAAYAASRRWFVAKAAIGLAVCSGMWFGMGPLGAWMESSGPIWDKPVEVVELDVGGLDGIEGPGFAPLLERLRQSKSASESRLWMERGEAADLIEAKRERIDHALSSYAREKAHLAPTREDEKYFIQSQKVDQWWSRAVSRSYVKKDLMAAFGWASSESDGYGGLRSAWRAKVNGSGLMGELLILAGLFCSWMCARMIAGKASERMEWARSQMISESERDALDRESRTSATRVPSKRL